MLMEKVKSLIWLFLLLFAVSPAMAQSRLAKATFAGGCFWCMEPPFDKLPGVVSTTSGYAGGAKKNPTYQEVSAGATGHAEVVQVLYDPSKIKYEKLLEVFWYNIDPFAVDRQFCDSGSQYRSGIFYHDENQKKLALESRMALEKDQKFKGKIATEIVPLKEFYPAEEYHQDFYKKNPLHYNSYRMGCRRDNRLAEIWGGAPKSK
jgi:peptide-methionine (S)-S-oxide reductase